MGQIIKKFKDGSYLEYDDGAFDQWCVYLKRPDMDRYPPKDIQYFQQLVDLAAKYSPEKLYADFVSIYTKTGGNIDNQTLVEISNISAVYKDNCVEVDILLTILYMGMVAEENKAFTKLGKKIKRLGVHQILIDKMQPCIAANYSRGKGWRDIFAECKNKGF